MRQASGPMLRPSAAATPGGVVLLALGLAGLAVVAALAAGLSAGTTAPEPVAPGFPRPVADLVTPTPGMLGERAAPAGH
ncbi:MAG: hypothetical protein AB7V44_14095 [Pseudonocardia sp.]